MTDFEVRHFWMALGRDAVIGDELDRLAGLAEKATPGPWRHGPLFWEGWSNWQGDGGVRVFEVPHVYPNGAHQPGVFVDPEIGRTHEPDAAYIAACDPDTIRSLIEAARLGVAWAEAEAALPPKFRLHLDKMADVRYDAEARPPFMDYERWHRAVREASGPTPVAALEALTAKLRAL